MGAQQSPDGRAPAAETIVQLLTPVTVLVSGAAASGLADDLRRHGVEVDDAGAAGGSARSYDLVVHVDSATERDDDAEALVDALAAGEIVLFSSGGVGPSSAEGTAGWARLFAEHGLFRDLEHDAGYIAPDAALFRRSTPALAVLVQRYEQALADLRLRADADVARLDAEHRQLRKEILRTRDLAFGRQAELASALARVAQVESTLARYDTLEQRFHDVLNSRSWRFTQTLGLPLRMLRQRH
jgi:hypothetical protein